MNGGNVSELTRALTPVLKEIENLAALAQRAILELQDDPDDATIERAMVVLTAIRDVVDGWQMMTRLGCKLRDVLVAELSTSAPGLKMAAIAQAAGYNDSMAARVANRQGAGRRPRTGQQPDTQDNERALAR